MELKITMFHEGLPNIDPEQNTIAIDDLVGFVRVSKSTIYRWIKEEKIKTKIVDGKTEVYFNEFITNKFEINSHKFYSQPYIPVELKDFHLWYETLDYLTWLFKISYSPKELIKAKKFRMDNIFINYLTLYKITPKKIKKAFKNDIKNRKMVVDDLKRAWYNELAFIYPLKKMTLGLSFNDIEINKDISNNRFTFPSWKIIQSYYSIYFYLRAVTQLNFSDFHIEKHEATINSFKYNTLPVLKKVIWKFPLDIDYIPNERKYRKELLINKLDYTKFQYCFHPRKPHLPPEVIYENIYTQFSRKGKSFKRPAQYTIFDFLLEFRIWSNYLDIDNLLSLWGPGYRSFLDQNISFLLFIIGGISEMCFLSIFGEQQYINELQKFHDLFAANNEEIKDNFTITSIYQRFKIYKYLGYIESDIKFEEKIDFNKIIVY